MADQLSSVTAIMHSQQKLIDDLQNTIKALKVNQNRKLNDMWCQIQSRVHDLISHYHEDGHVGSIIKDTCHLDEMHV